MYALIEFVENNDMGEASRLLVELEKLGFNATFAVDIPELIGIAGGKIVNQEEFDEIGDFASRTEARYENMRSELRQTHVGAGDTWLALEDRRIKKVKAQALIDIAESLTLIVGAEH